MKRELIVYQEIIVHGKMCSIFLNKRKILNLRCGFLERKLERMIFEVKKNNKTVMQTIEENCIPDKGTRDDMRRAGYKLYLDGKIYKEKSR